LQRIVKINAHSRFDVGSSKSKPTIIQIILLWLINPVLLIVRMISKMAATSHAIVMPYKLINTLIEVLILLSNVELSVLSKY